MHVRKTGMGPEIIESLTMGAEGLSDIELEQLRMLLYQFSSIISTSDSDIGRSRLVQHHIDIQGANPVKQPPRRLPFHPREEVIRMLNDMLAQGVIESATAHGHHRLFWYKRKMDQPGSVWISVN